jgi:hypothetical protein
MRGGVACRPRRGVTGGHATPPRLTVAGVGLLGRWRSPDGAWHVEVWQRGSEQWYRVRYLGGLYADKAGLATVQRILREQGDVEWADLIED